MMKMSVAALLASAALFCAPAQALTVTDSIGDILPSYTGTISPDLDVVSFSVNYNSATEIFSLSGTMAGAIEASTNAAYVIGVDTGTGVNAPFGSIGQPDVIFNQVVVVRSDGTGNVGVNALSPTIDGATFSVDVPLAFLPSTGAAATDYGFNLWPRVGFGNNDQISDFAPENATVSVASGVPEPASWAMMIFGLASVGGAMRSRKPCLRRLTVA